MFSIVRRVMSFYTGRNGGVVERVNYEVPLRRTRAVVDLRCLRENLALLQACMPWAGLLPALKANAYGHGAVEVGLACQRWGVAGACVATLSEAAELRHAGFSARLLLLEDAFPSEISAAVALGLSLTVSSASRARQISTEAMRQGRSQRVHVKVDTGMGRLGVFYREAVPLVEEILSLPGIELEGVYSHFSSADEELLGGCYQQIERFRWVLRRLEERGIRPVFRHMANSAAMLQLSELLHEDGLARPGIALYGLSPRVGFPLPTGMKPLLSLESRLLKVSRFSEPWPVGYGGSWQAAPGACVGIVPMGYADGYARTFSNRASVLVRGRRVAVVGRVSMDMLAVDLTSLVRDGEDVEAGEPVVLLGRQSYRDDRGRNYSDVIPAEEWARLCETIPYEIVCRISARVPRVYLS